MPTNVNELRADQISEASNLLARAFRDDPLASCMFPDATSREKFLVYHFGAIVKRPSGGSGG
ncbi:MAG: hypothetical protein HY297_00065 [Thaumarchaeota archaeon]|nr:hypothetical protein [Nitrososphaerota archaeon]